MPQKKGHGRKAGIVQTPVVTASATSSARYAPSGNSSISDSATATELATRTTTHTSSGLPSFVTNPSDAFLSPSPIALTSPQPSGRSSGVNQDAAIGGAVAGTALLIFTVLAFCYRHTLGRWFNRVTPAPADPVVEVINNQGLPEEGGIDGVQELREPDSPARAISPGGARVVQVRARDAVNTL